MLYNLVSFDVYWTILIDELYIKAYFWCNWSVNIVILDTHKLFLDTHKAILDTQKVILVKTNTSTRFLLNCIFFVKAVHPQPPNPQPNHPTPHPPPPKKEVMFGLFVCL